MLHDVAIYLTLRDTMLGLLRPSALDGRPRQRRHAVAFAREPHQAPCIESPREQKCRVIGVVAAPALAQILCRGQALAVITRYCPLERFPRGRFTRSPSCMPRGIRLLWGR